MITGELVVDVARTYVGTPVVEGGRSREGLDCIGLVLGVAHDLGLNGPQDVKGYGLNPWLHPKSNDALALMSQYMDRTDCPQVGDVVFFGLGRIAISLGIVSETANGAIKRIIGGLEAGSHFTEYEFVPEKSFAVGACFRFRMKN